MLKDKALKHNISDV